MSQSQMASAPEMQLADHAKKLQAEFNLKSNEEMAILEIPGIDNPALEERVFQIANEVALKFAVQHWSNFHTWKFFRGIHTEEEARQHAPHLWESVEPFSTCLGTASRVTVALQEALRQEADLKDFAERGQLVGDTPLEEFKKMTFPRFHCITIVRFLGYCIVIDLTAQFLPSRSVSSQSMHAQGN
jgi:hypothetical protein